MNRILHLLLKLVSAVALLVIAMVVGVLYFFSESPVEIGGQQYQLGDFTRGWIIEMKAFDPKALGMSTLLICIIIASLYFVSRRSPGPSPSKVRTTPLPTTILCPHCGSYSAQVGSFCPHCGKTYEIAANSISN